MRWQVCSADKTNHQSKPGTQACVRMLVTRATGMIGLEIGYLGSIRAPNSRHPPRGYRRYRHRKNSPGQPLSCVGRSEPNKDSCLQAWRASLLHLGHADWIVHSLPLPSHW